VYDWLAPSRTRYARNDPRVAVGPCHDGSSIVLLTTQSVSPSYVIDSTWTPCSQPSSVRAGPSLGWTVTDRVPDGSLSPCMPRWNRCSVLPTGPLGSPGLPVRTTTLPKPRYSFQVRLSSLVNSDVS